jgi:hypothetical protein
MLGQIKCMEVDVGSHLLNEFQIYMSSVISQFFNAQKASLKSTLQFLDQTIKLCEEKIMDGQYVVNFEKHIHLHYERLLT